MYMTDFAYDGPIFLDPLSPSYPSSPVYNENPGTECRGKKGESAAVCFIRSAAKALAKRGDEKSGAHSKFKDYIRSKLDDRVRLEPFSGNQFNILFIDAAIVFYYRDYIVDFLENHFSSRNMLLERVLNNCKDHHNVAAARALGLLEKLVTKPLWEIIESKCHIFDMNVHYCNLLRFLEEASHDASSFMRAVTLCPSQAL